MELSGALRCWFASWRALVWLRRWHRRQDAAEAARGRYFLWLGRATGKRGGQERGGADER